MIFQALHIVQTFVFLGLAFAILVGMGMVMSPSQEGRDIDWHELIGGALRKGFYGAAYVMLGALAWSVSGVLFWSLVVVAFGRALYRLERSHRLARQQSVPAQWTEDQL